MRTLIVATAGCLLASLCACGKPEDPEPSLTITPGEVTSPITAPMVFSAVLTNSDAEVTWTVTNGTLSSTKGLHVTYTPPAGTATGAVTATAGDLSASVPIKSEPASTKIAGLKAPVTVLYDAQDIPHIQCASAVDCVAAQGYLQARDRLFPMDFLRHVAKGTVAELVGQDGLSQDIQFRALFLSRDGKRLEAELVKAIDPATKALLDAFVVGVNAYLAELRAGRGALPGEYAQLPFPITPADIADWTAQDTLALARLQQFQLSESLNGELANGVFALTYGPGGAHQDLGRFDAWIRAAAPPSEQAHTLSATGTHIATPTPAAVAPAAIAPKKGRGVDLSGWRNALRASVAATAQLKERLRPADATVGSNNWAVAASKSAANVAMVANDPHLSLQYPPLFHLAVMTSSRPEDHLNLTGGSFPGIPGALVGRGEHVGWGVTVVGYDVTDVYMERFLPQANCPGGNAGPPCVLFNNGAVSTIPVPQTFLVRIGPGTAGLVNAGDPTVRSAHPGLPSVPPLLLVVPHHGPVIQAPDANGKAISFRWTGHETNTQDLKAFYGLNTAVNVDGAIEALKNFATGAQNFVLADDQGHIAYDPHALVPVRPFAVKGSRLLPWLPLPGDGSAEWGPPGSHCDNPAGNLAACWISDAELPQGKDPAKGYFFTANADPLGVSDDNDPLPDPAASEPPYMSFDWSDSSGFRATRIEQMIEAAIADHGKVSLADMEKIQSDHVSRPGMAFAPILAALPTAGAPPELAAAKAILAQWATNGFDCPSAVVGTDPKGPADTNATVLQNSAGCFLFHVFIRALVTNVFTDDLRVAGQGVDALAAAKAILLLLGRPDGAPGTAFCSDVDRSAAVVASKTCGAQVVAALVQAYATLVGRLGADPKNWIWGRVHTIRPVSLLQLVTVGYEPGPYARPGGAFTVDVGNPSLSGSSLTFSYNSGGNVRHISLMDPANPKVRMQLPGPERDGPFIAGRGPDLLGQWVKNSYFDYAHGDQITRVAVSTQVFKAP